VASISATRAIRAYRGPVLLAHGDLDTVVPLSHLARLEAAARATRADDPNAAPVETLVVEGGHHSWLYEFPAYRAAVARFLAAALGGPYDPATAADLARAVPAERIPDGEGPITAVAAEPGGLRTLAGVALPGAARIRAGVGRGDGTGQGAPAEAAPAVADP
jgi:dienelactone hydrolase